MEWDSPWGRGFPGWHIECSAMSIDTLKKDLDIHCGGIDHIPVHHTNEIAQAEGAGEKFFNVWMHGEFLVLGGKAKMAKSAGNFLTLDLLIEEGNNRPQKAPYDPLAYRYLCLTAHYRTQLEFGWEAMDFAQKSLDALRTQVWRLEQESDGAASPSCAEYEERFLAALSDDLNVPKALAVVWEAARDEKLPAKARLAFLRHADDILALDAVRMANEKHPAELLPLIKEREGARQKKDFKKADELRGKIGELGYYVEDTAAGSRLVRK
jgi:cysteinyl-tRNA synthetase